MPAARVSSDSGHFSVCSLCWPCGPAGHIRDLMGRMAYFPRGTVDAMKILSTEKPEPLKKKSISHRNGELRTQKLKSHLLRTQSLKVLLYEKRGGLCVCVCVLKPGVGQYVATHATLTARDFFPADFYPSGPFARISSKTSPEFFPC